MNRLKKHASTLKLPHKAKPSLRKAIISHGNDELIRCICECTLNVLQGHAPISQQHKNCLSRHQKGLRELTDRKVSLKNKRKIIQKGGFRCLTFSRHSYSSISYWWFGVKMRKLVALEPEVYEKLKEPKGNIETKILSDLDKQMNEILISQYPDHEKVKLYNQGLQKSRFYEKKRHKPKEGILKEKTLPLLEKDIIKKVKRKPVRAKRILDRMKKQENVNWNSKGQFLLDKQPIPSSNIADL